MWTATTTTRRTNGSGRLMSKTDASDVLITAIKAITKLLTHKRFLIAAGVVFAVWSFNEEWWDSAILREVVAHVVAVLAALGKGG